MTAAVVTAPGEHFAYDLGTPPRHPLAVCSRLRRGGLAIASGTARVTRTHKLLQPTRGSGRRRRPGFFRVTRPDELWHIDMTKVWTAQHGWVYLHAMIDCCTREITGWNLELRCRDDEAIDAVEHAVLARGVRPGELTLGSDNGS